MNFLKNLNKRTLAVAAVLLASAGAVIAGTATGATGTTDFDIVVNRMNGWLGGSLGKTFALGALAVGLAIGIVKQSVMSVVTGAAVALSASIGPGVLSGIFTAVL